MGGNGTASVNGCIPAEEQRYVSHGAYVDPDYGEIKIVEWTGTGQNKSPEESNSAPRMYMTFYKNGSGINEIAKYGADHKKEWAIHTNKHKGLQPHIHPWKNGVAQEPEPIAHDDPRLALLRRAKEFYKTKK
jgi:hypothetical protein